MQLLGYLNYLKKKKTKQKSVFAERTSLKDLPNKGFSFSSGMIFGRRNRQLFGIFLDYEV